MKLKDIPRTPSQSHMSPDVQQLQRNAHRYVKWIIEKSRGLPEIRSLTELPQGSIQGLRGGYTSALYRIETTDNNFVVAKLRKDGLDAEQEALEAWKLEGVPIPNIRHKGMFTGTKTLPPVKYLLLDFIVDKSGEQASTGTDYLERRPGRAYRLGQAMGRTLARMHRAKSSRSFGEFADMEGSNKPLRSWNSYLMGYVDVHGGFLRKLGMSQKLIDELRRTIRSADFPSRGAYLHGDYSLRNLMVRSSKPLGIVIFDPNPLIGDPSWDIAVLFNNRDYRSKRYAWQPQNPVYRKIALRDEHLVAGFWRSYRSASKEKISLERIWLAQLVQSLVHIQAEEARPYPSRTEKELELQVRREALFERLGRLSLLRSDT